MAKNFNDIYNSVFTTGNKMDWTNAMIRGNGIPLDYYSVFDSYNNAVVYAANNPVAYEGQVLAVTENGDTIVYVVTPASQGTVTIDDTEVTVYLKEVGKATIGDDKSITLNEETGELSIVGVDTAETGSQLTKQSDGTVAWVKPDTTTVEGLSSAVDTLQGQVGSSSDEASASGSLYARTSQNAADITILKGDSSTNGSVEYKIANAEPNEKTTTYITQQVGAVDDRVDGILDGTTISSFSEAETAIADAKKAGTDAQGNVTALTTRVTTAEENITNLNSNKVDTTTFQPVSDDVDTLIGTDTGKSVRTIANEELAAQLIPESASESLDTLQEIAAWIQSHPDDASAMNEAITALQNKLSGIDDGTGTVKKYIDDAITALNIGDYAKAADLTALAARVTANEIDIAGITTTLGTVLKYKGTINAYDTLPTNPVVGDVYNIKNTSTAVETTWKLVPVTNAYVSDSGEGWNELWVEITNEITVDGGYWFGNTVNLYDSNLNLIITLHSATTSGTYVYASVGQDDPDTSTIAYAQVDGYEESSSATGIDVNKTFTVNAGDNVVWDGSRWDVFAGHIDLSGYAQRSSTLSGYGITNAYTKDQVDAKSTKLQNNIDAVDNKVGTADDTASATGTLYARVAKNADDIATKASTTELNSLKGIVDGHTTKLNGIEENAEVNVIESITVNGTAAVIADKAATVTLPTASSSAIGLVKSTDIENGVAVDSTGTMTLNNVNVNKLVQTESDTLILYGGASATYE